MPLRSSKQVIAGLQVSARRATKRVKHEYEAGIADPIRDLVDSETTLSGLFRKVNTALLDRLESEDIEAALQDQMINSALIGRVSATPKGDGR